MSSRKSIRIARYLSFLIPGLGLIYVNRYFTGLVWMILSIPIIIAEVIMTKVIIDLYVIGGDKYFTRRFNPEFTAFVILAAYLWCGWYSSREAVKAAIDYNGHQHELEKIDSKL